MHFLHVIIETLGNKINMEEVISPSSPQSVSFLLGSFPGPRKQISLCLSNNMNFHDLHHNNVCDCILHSQMFRKLYFLNLQGSIDLCPLLYFGPQIHTFFFFFRQKTRTGNNLGYQNLCLHSCMLVNNSTQRRNLCGYPLMQNKIEHV